MVEVNYDNRVFKLRPLRLRDRESLFKEFGDLKMTPSSEARMIELCLEEPKLTLDEVLDLSATTTDFLYLQIQKLSLPSKDFLSEWDNIFSQAQPLLNMQSTGRK